jgi:endonuclease I
VYDALHELLVRTHRTQPRYSPARHLYPWVDRHENGAVISIYTGDHYESVQELIREELAKEQEFARRASELAIRFRSEAALAAAEFQADLLALEQQFVFNCEHVVPQSWFSKREPMRGDLHHLFACQIKCNSDRGNTPYWDFPDFPGPGEAVSPACGKSAPGKFEPRRGKGSVARATLYFLVRYPHEIGDRASELQGDRLEIVKRWAKENPVTAYERHRNRAIYEAQGNRNPLIDLADLFPEAYAEMIDRIDFRRGFGG